MQSLDSINYSITEPSVHKNSTLPIDLTEGSYLLMFQMQLLAVNYPINLCGTVFVKRHSVSCRENKMQISCVLSLPTMKGNRTLKNRQWISDCAEANLTFLALDIRVYHGFNFSTLQHLFMPHDYSFFF